MNENEFSRSFDEAIERAKARLNSDFAQVPDDFERDVVTVEDLMEENTNLQRTLWTTIWLFLLVLLLEAFVFSVITYYKGQECLRPALIQEMKKLEQLPNGAVK